MFMTVQGDSIMVAGIVRAHFKQERNMPAIHLSLLCLALVLVMGGCSKKVTRSGVPFDMDKIAFESVDSSVEDWKAKGVRLARQKEYAEAIDAFSRYIEETPGESFGYNALAVCYKNIGDQRQAMKNFDKALELAPKGEERAKILGNIGNMYFSSGKMQAALGFYKDAAAEFEENPFYVILVARTFVSMNDFDRARKALSQAEPNLERLDSYEREEDRGQGYYLLAQSYAALNDENRLWEYLDKAFKANPMRFISKINKDTSDEMSLFYTLKDDIKLQKLLKRYSARASYQSAP